ncbi:MAG: molybdopterin molybdotransferase [Methylobacteriaceae bacterium]|nr:molybdopterin molybdotransferase [Methylobacteriaceae bacterium]
MRLVPLVEARAAFLAKIEPVASGAIATAKAGGLVLAEDVVAPANFPPYALALERGYAIAARATVGASSYVPSLLPKMPPLVEAGEALPPGSDTILDPEDLREAAGGAEVVALVPPGRHVRTAGGDIGAGRVIVSAGARLKGVQVAVLRAAGFTEVLVRVPGVVVVGPQGSCASAALVMDWTARAGADVHLAYVPQARLAGALRSAAGADLVLVAGWSGAAFQAALGALTESGRIVARDLAVAPGSATACGFIDPAGRSAPAVLLPGRLEETLAAWLLIARPCLDRLTGYSGPRPSAALPLARKIASAPGMADLALLKREADRWKPLAAGDISWAAIAESDAWLAIPAESEGFASGEIVEAEFL